MSEIQDEEKVQQLIDVREDVARLEERLAEKRTEAKKLEQDVAEMIQAAADRHLVDDNGQPVDGAVYWYRRLALVRLGTVVRIIPLKAMDGKEVFVTPSIELPAEELVEEMVESPF